MIKKLNYNKKYSKTRTKAKGAYFKKQIHLLRFILLTKQFS